MITSLTHRINQARNQATRDLIQGTCSLNIDSQTYHPNFSLLEPPNKRDSFVNGSIIRKTNENKASPWLRHFGVLSPESEHLVC